MRRWIKRVIGVLVVLGILAALGAWALRRENGSAVTFRTSPVTKGNVVVTISATGTIEPQEVVDVGAQVAGKIVSFGADASGNPVDYRSPVNEGTVLAKIDDVLYRADVDQAQASVMVAKAGVQRAESDLGQMVAKLKQAERDWGRAQKLGPSEALSQSAYDAYESAYETAKANVAVDNATIDQSRATLAQAQSVLSRAQLNLGYCTITSPVKGVVIDRRVNTGQTVVSSLNAPSLFLIAKDLTKMEVWVAVNEADVGRIRPGQSVTFGVDAFAGQAFKGEVGKVRLNASMTQNVVTYPVVILIDNSKGQLLPYLTANVRFEVARADNVLMVPNAALRWKPAAGQVAPEYAAAAATRGGNGGARRPSGDNETATGSEAPVRGGVVWVVEGQRARPVQVRVGLTDGVDTEVSGEGLSEGLQVVTGVHEAGAAPVEAKSPFTPTLPGRRPAGTGGGAAPAGGSR